MKPDIVIEEPYAEKKRKIVYNPSAQGQNNFNVEILRIAQEEELTRIDFMVPANPKYKNGGWVSMEPETFIRPVNTNVRLTMVQAVNIPVKPVVHCFKSKAERLYYTLYFPKLPDDVVAIDIIEKETARPHNFFNFYGVSLEKIATQIITVIQN